MDECQIPMDEYQDLVEMNPRKRRRICLEEMDQETTSAAFTSLDELNQDLLEKILSYLPPSTFFRLRSVCKRWNSVANSPTFRIACSQVPSRDPWFFMVDPELIESIVFDTSENNWKNLNCPPPLLPKSIPVASSGGLLCFRNDASGELIISNPLTGACRQLPPAEPNQTIHAICMNSSPKSPHFYKLVVVSRDIPNLVAKVYDSGKDQWEDEITLHRKTENVSGDMAAVDGDETLYFLSKAGDVVTTNMQRSPSKQYSSVMTVEGGEDVVYFLSLSGTVVACNLNQKSFFEYPRILPVCFEYSIDVVECNGEMLVVVLSEILESSSLRVWKFDDSSRQWQQVAAMPPAMSHEFYGKKADVNCGGCGDVIFMCISSGDCSSSYVMCDLATDKWSEMPRCFVDGGREKEFMSACSFEPRVEACV